jgi:hypothetical protein
VRLIVLYILVIFSFACSDGGKTEGSTEQMVARAGDEILEVDDYTEKFLSSAFVKDSLFNAKRSIESWAREALFYQEATSKLTMEEMQVEEQIEDYRKALINHTYQTRLIEANLDTTITSDEIQSYYDTHRDNFILKENILKVHYVKIAQRSGALGRIKKLLGSRQTKDKEQLLNLCVQNAENFFLNDSTWLFFDDIKKEIPALDEQSDFQLSAGRVMEFNDEMYYYYLKINDIKVKNGLSPLNFEMQNIRQFIINNRKTLLINEYKHELLEKAKANKDFVRY